MANFVQVALLDDLAPGRAIVIVAGESAVALFNVRGRVFAVDDSCVRCGSSLAGGELDGTSVTCSGCDWQYDVTTGCVIGIPALRVDTFETKIVDSRVMVATILSSV